MNDCYQCGHPHSYHRAYECVTEDGCVCDGFSPIPEPDCD